MLVHTLFTSAGICVCFIELCSGSNSLSPSGPVAKSILSTLGSAGLEHYPKLFNQSSLDEVHTNILARIHPHVLGRVFLWDAFLGVKSRVVRMMTKLIMMVPQS